VDPARLSELLRHTGAGSLLRSGTIDDEGGMTRHIELRRAFDDMVRRKPHRPARLNRARIICPISTNVKDHYRRTGVPQTAQLLDGNALRCGRRVSPVGIHLVQLKRTWHGHGGVS
jgi:hypothetical protein